ncbi:MAG: DUF1854 domain-containing protein [Clostridia bacterium]|nr:DUF1854 domain-containing protein [Clostridia bacterium]
MNHTLSSIIEIVYLTPDNATFYQKGDFLALTTHIKGEEQDHGVIKLRRLFPFEELWCDITVMNAAGEEIGVIASLEPFGDTKALLVNELERVYFTPKISKIYSMKDKYGFSSWDVETDIGRITFSVKDTFRSIISLGQGRAIITDVDGSRYEIPDATKLDKSSYKKVELYL